MLAEVPYSQHLTQTIWWPGWQKDKPSALVLPSVLEEIPRQTTTTTTLMVFRSDSSLRFIIILVSRAYCLAGHNNAPTYLPTSSSFFKFKVSSKFDQVVARSSLSSGIFAGQVRQKRPSSASSSSKLWFAHV